MIDHKFIQDGRSSDLTGGLPYITPITTIHSTFAEAKESYDQHRGLLPLDDEELNIKTLTLGKRNFIVGDPGIGKSLLLSKLEKHLSGEGIKADLIRLRQEDALQRIDTFLSLGTGMPKALLLDGLDEAKTSSLPAIIKKIEAINAEHSESDLRVFISGRWAFVNRYATSFSEYRFITIHPFTRSQVRDYLLAAGRPESDVEDLLGRMMFFGHQMLVLQVPRYLSYLDDFLRQKGLEATSKVSRNELFEHFIYRKLEIEDQKLNADKRALIKRVLEKLALAMEIYQANVLTKDELMTFFDDLKSDLKVVALAQFGIEVLYDYSLLKASTEEITDKIEFDNAEFQEFLAAREITRFPDPSRTAFAFAVDPDANEIYPSWYNTLTFLADMQQNLLEQLVEFSGLRANKFKVMDSAFLMFLSRVDTRGLTDEFRRCLFQDIVAYHNRTQQRLPDHLAFALPAFFDHSLEPYLKERVAAAESEVGEHRFVSLANIVYILAYLLRGNAPLDRKYWRGRLIAYACGQDDVLQRQALFALQSLRDPTVIDDLPDFKGSEELVSREFLSLCTEVAPDHPKCVDYFLEAVKRDDLYGRYGLFALKEKESIKRYLVEFIGDEKFREEFMDDTSIFRGKDSALLVNIENIFDAEVKDLCEQVVVCSTNYKIAHKARNSSFVPGIWKLLRKVDSRFVVNIIDKIKASEGRSGLHYASFFFAQIIELQDVEAYIEALISASEKRSAVDTMIDIRLSRRENADLIYESGRQLLAEEYRNWESAKAEAGASLARKRSEALIREFRSRLEPEPGMYSQDVFWFYNNNFKDLASLLTLGDRERLREILCESIFKYVNPGEHGLVITSENQGSKSFRVNSSVHVFGDALLTAKHLDVDVRPYRRQILRYIPFAYGEELAAIFDLVVDIEADEMEPIIEVYRARHTDLWRHNPESFVRAVARYHVTDAVPVLREMILRPAWELYVRQQALSVVDSVVPDAGFLGKVIEKFCDSTDEEEKRLAEAANELLIRNHTDADAIRWRLGQVTERAVAHVRPTGVRIHSVDDLEVEISFGRRFAGPLMSLSHLGYEEDYLKLIDEAMELWGRGGEFYQYASYLWDIAYSYFDNLKVHKSYSPLRMLENKMAVMKDREGANWLAGRMVGLRRSYLGYLGKPDNFSRAIAKYNYMRSYDDKGIQSSADLFRHLQDAFDVYLRRWIEGEGAYDILRYRLRESGPQQYEKLVQKTLKAQIENILLRQGFQVEVLREPQLLDEKRTDFLVRYGFAGPIIVEVKLASNKDLSRAKLETSPSYASMERYMQGYGASHGIFLIIDNCGIADLPRVTAAFQQIRGVWVTSFNCSQGVAKTKGAGPARRRRN